MTRAPADAAPAATVAAWLACGLLTAMVRATRGREPRVVVGANVVSVPKPRSR